MRSTAIKAKGQSLALFETKQSALAEATDNVYSIIQKLQTARLLVVFFGGFVVPQIEIAPS
jgi:hypothetical protein